MPACMLQPWGVKDQQALYLHPLFHSSALLLPLNGLFLLQVLAPPPPPPTHPLNPFPASHCHSI